MLKIHFILGNFQDNEFSVSHDGLGRQPGLVKHAMLILSINVMTQQTFQSKNWLNQWIFLVDP